MERQIAYYLKSKRAFRNKLEQEGFEVAGTGIFSSKEITQYLAEIMGPYLIIYSDDEVSNDERNEKSRLVQIADKFKFTPRQ